ncbi:MAG: stage III sporulation protein AA [Firmicutes bacterium]|nr:stage III sporulation protein AA [Bacillota bacterium]
MNHLEQVFSCFPQQIRQQISTLDPFTRQHLQEIRVYKNREVQVFADNRRMQLSGVIKGSDINNILNNLMKFSYYAYEEDLAKGFITIDGGHRVGICGKAVMEKGRVTLLREISSFNIRYAKEIIGCSDTVMHHVISTDNAIHNVIIVSPPGCGKTTMLRDIARNLSLKHYKVAICDERSEIAGMHDGISSYHFGPMVDVLDGCPKAEGMMMLIRCMSPDVIIADEIGRPEDMKAIETCRHAGVSIITTAHGYSMEDIDAIHFDKVIFLQDRPHPGSVREVIDV